MQGWAASRLVIESVSSAYDGRYRIKPRHLAAAPVALRA
jgi:hypothetical protein